MVLFSPPPPDLEGFFPAEMVFTERAIPVLVKHGIEWVVVANNHMSRACKVGGRCGHQGEVVAWNG